MANRNPYDGQPYYCLSCGEALGTCNPATDDCIPEKEAAAQLRAQRKRPAHSDLADAVKRAAG